MAHVHTAAVSAAVLSDRHVHARRVVSAPSTRRLLEAWPPVTVAEGEAPTGTPKPRWPSLLCSTSWCTETIDGDGLGAGGVRHHLSRIVSSALNAQPVHKVAEDSSDDDPGLQLPIHGHGESEDGG